MNKSEKDALKKVHSAEAELKTSLYAEGDKIAKAMGYPGLKGMDAIVRYLVDKHHWTPETVRHFTVEELELLLEGWNRDTV